MLLFCVRACIFSSKKDSKIRVNKTNPNNCIHSYQTKRGGAYYTSFENATTFTRQHPSIHRTTHDEYYYYRIETPTTIAAVKRSRERDRETESVCNLLIVQEEGKRKNLREKKKRGKFCPPHN